MKQFVAKRLQSLDRIAILLKQGFKLLIRILEEHSLHNFIIAGLADSGNVAGDSSIVRKTEAS